MALTEKTRGRAWTFVIYQEDFNYKQIKDFFDKYGVAVAISPLHGADEEDKKPHWHIILLYAGNKNPSVLWEELGHFRKKGDWHCFQKVTSISAMTRYLIHKDHPQKEQFEGGKNLITTFYGFDLEKYFKSESDEVRIYGEILDYVLKKRVSFLGLNVYAHNNNSEWLPIIVKRSYAISLLCRQVQKEGFDDSIKELIKNCG